VTRSAVALAGLALLTVPGAAQQPPVFHIDLDLVNVTVTVRDARGGLVSDLHEQDFEVLEDGRPQKVQLFAPASSPEERKELALNLGMLFDTSESMRKDLRLSQQSAVRFLDAIPRARDLVLVFFDRDIRLSRYSSENQQGIFERILETEGGGETALLDAITVYVSRVADTPGRKVLVLFTDGEDSQSELTEMDMNKLVRSSPVTIYSIAFSPDGITNSSRASKSRRVLHHLADLTGGEVFAPSTYRDLPGIYDKILDELKGQYVIGYVPDRGGSDSKRFHRLKVEVGRKGLHVRHREGYEVAELDPDS